MTESTYLVVATSGRAIAQSLKALDHRVAVIDGFADQDTIAAACVCKKVNRVRFGLDAAEVENAIQSLRDDFTFTSLFYDAAIEVNPKLLEIVNDLNIVGNAYDSLHRCKDPHQFFPVLDKHSIIYPEIRFNSNIKDSKQWLFKHHRSTGGIGINMTVHNVNDLEHCYSQKIIKGTSFSLTIIANGQDIYVLGANTQWHEQLSEAVPFAYAGAINQVKLGDDAIATAKHYAKTIVKEFDLVGLNSIDYICDDNDVYVLEVNPRIPASYELYETKYGDLMRKHIIACNERRLPTEQSQKRLRAHAIIYAPHEIQIPTDVSWPLWTADRPHPGENIQQFEPICNVFSGGKNYSQVCEMIATRKKAVLNKLTT